MLARLLLSFFALLLRQQSH